MSLRRWLTAFALFALLAPVHAADAPPSADARALLFQADDAASDGKATQARDLYRQLRQKFPASVEAEIAGERLAELTNPRLPRVNPEVEQKRLEYLKGENEANRKERIEDKTQDRQERLGDKNYERERLRLKEEREAKEREEERQLFKEERLRELKERAEDRAAAKAKEEHDRLEAKAREERELKEREQAKLEAKEREKEAKLEAKEREKEAKQRAAVVCSQKKQVCVYRCSQDPNAVSQAGCYQSCKMLCDD